MRVSGELAMPTCPAAWYCHTHFRDVFPQLLTFIHLPPPLPLSQLERLRITALWQLMEAVVHCATSVHPKSMCVCVCVFTDVEELLFT